MKTPYFDLVVAHINTGFEHDPLDDGDGRETLQECIEDAERVAQREGKKVWVVKVVAEVIPAAPRPQKNPSVRMVG